MVNSTRFDLKKILLTGILVISILTSFSQSVSTYWQYNRPGPIGYDITDLCYVNNTVGYACGSSGVISRTTDGGRTWVHDYLPGKPYIDAIFFPSEKTGYVVTLDGRIAKTTNRGITWSFIASPAAAASATLNNLYFFDDNNGFVVGSPFGGAANIFKTTNGGATWTSVATGYPVQNRNIMAIQFINATVGYTCGASGHMAKTTDGGATWTNISFVAGNPVQPGTVNILSQTYAGLTVIDPQTAIVSSMNNTFIVKTTNGGTNWTCKVAQTGTPTTLAGSQPMFNLVSKGNDVAVAAGSFCGVSHDAGETWTFKKPFVNSGILSVLLNSSIEMTPNKTVKIAGAYGIMADSVSGAANWDTSYYKNLTYHPAYSRSMLSASALDKNNILVSGSEGLVYRTTDGGKTWLDRQIPEFQQPFYLKVDVKDIKYPAADAAYMACSNGYVYRSLDRGDTWPNTYAFTPGSGSSILGMDFIDGNIGWICGGKGTVNSGFIYRNLDGGLNWNVQTGTLTGASYIYSIDFVNLTTGWASGTSGKVFKSTDGGNNWVPQTVPATVTGNLFTIAFTATADTGWAAGISGKIIYTVDGGTTWTAQTSGITAPINKLMVINGKIAVAFCNGGTCIKTIDGGVTWTDFSAPTNDALIGATFMLPYNSINPGVNPANVDMMVVGGKSLGAQSPTIMYAKLFYAAPIPPVPAIINVNDKCASSLTAKGKILNPPPFTQIDIVIDAEPLLYSPEDSSFTYYLAGITAPGNHTVKVTFTNSGGVVFKDTTYAFYTVNSTPSVSIVSNDADNIICEGQSVTYNATASVGGLTPSYQWKVNGVNVGTNSNRYTYVPVANDVVTVVMTSSFACVTSATATSNAIVSTIPQFTANILQLTGNRLLVSFLTPGATYQWLKNGQPMVGETGTSLTVRDYGTYSVMITLNTCSKLSNSIVIGPGTNPREEIVVFPVPATTVVNVKTNSLSSLVKSITVYDATGAKVGMQTYPGSNIAGIDISRLAKGTYIIRVETTDNIIAKKFEKQ